MTHSAIYVVGSSNTDMVVKAEKLPSPGETVIGGDFLMNPGGKGANQAVAAARLGGQVYFVGKTGNDLFGKQAIQQFKRENIRIEHVATDPKLPSGVALINVDAHGENSISVAPGANAALTVTDVQHALSQLKKGDTVLIQLEIPVEVVHHVVRESEALGARVILNPAPAQPMPETTLGRLFLITPNETEAGLLTGIKVHDSASAAKAAHQLRSTGCRNVVITMGPKGAYIKSDDHECIIPAIPVSAVDTTAAGDCFNGALAVALSEGQDLLSAARFAAKAAAISVTRMGAQSSLPTRKELEAITLSTSSDFPVA